MVAMVKECRSFLLFPLLLFLFEGDLMDLDHGLLILLIVVGSNRPGRANHVDNLGELIHLGPMSGIEPIGIPDVNVSSISHQQLDNLFISETGRIVQGSHQSLVTDGRIGTVIEK
jgi:hypothetical protein